MNRRLRNALFALIGAAGALYLALVGYIVANETSIVFPGARERARTRRTVVPAANTGFQWDTVRLKAADGAPILLLVTRVDSLAARPWALYFHGNGGTLGEDDNVDRYRLLREAGFNVVAMEFRGFGALAGTSKPSSSSIAADAHSAWTYLTGTLSAPPSAVAVYGWSLGGGVAARLADEVGAPVLITEGTFTSLANMGRERYPWLPVSLVARNAFDNIGRARTTTKPWIVFHGRDDGIVPFAHGEAIANAGKTAKLVPLSGGHMDGVMADRALALKTLSEVALALAR